MAIEFFTGFEGCESNADIDSFFDDVFACVYTSTLGFNASKGIRATSTGAWFRKTVSASKTKTVGFHVIGAAQATLNTNHLYRSQNLIEFIGPSIIIANTSLGIQINQNSTELVTLSDIIPPTITHVEIKVFSDVSAGTIQLKINGTLVYDGSGLNTTGVDIAAFVFGCTKKTDCVFDNIYIADDFQGELYSVLKKPVSDGVTQFTPLSGTDNSAMIQTSDGDTSYVESDTVGHQDLYEYEDLAAGQVPVAVSVVNNMKKEGTGERLVQTRAKQDAVEYLVGDEFTVTPTYTHHNSVLNTAPDGTAWSDTKFNGLQLGYKITG